MAKFETEDKSLNKNLKQMHESIEGMENNVIKKSKTPPTTETMSADEINLYRDDVGDATLYFKDSAGNLFSLPMTKEK